MAYLLAERTTHLPLLRIVLLGKNLSSLYIERI